MATGDMTISVAVEGGVTKSVAVNSATRVLAKARANAINKDTNLSTDAAYQVSIVNKFAAIVVGDGNAQAESSAVSGLTSKTFTAAT